MSEAPLNNYLKNIEDVIRAELERVQSFYPSDLAIHPDFINDIREITMNRVNQVCKSVELEFKLQRINHFANSSSMSYANTLKNNVKNVVESVVNSNKEQPNETTPSTDKNDVHDAESISSVPDPLDELKGQRTLLNSLHIFGIPEELLKCEQIQTEIFRRLCKKLKAKVSEKDIEKTYAKKNALIVRLHRLEAKDKILECAEDRDVWTNDLCDLPKGMDPAKVKICHYMTPFYSKMWFTAEKFQTQGRLHSFKLSEKGLIVIRKPATKERVFLSEDELIEFIKN